MRTLSSTTGTPLPTAEQPYLLAAADLRRRRAGVVIGATVAMAFGFGCLALTSVFIRPLEADLQWSRAEVSLGYAAATIGMAVGGYIWGRLSDRLDIRVLLAIGGTGMVLALMSMALVQSLPQFYLANLVFGGFGFAVLYAPLLSATSQWFERSRGVAVGIVTAGGALGQGVVPFLASFLIDGLGWRLTFFSLAIVTLVALLLTLPRVTRPQRTGLPAGGRSPDMHAGARDERLRVSLLSLAAFLCCACMGIPLVHMASFVAAVCGSPALGATSLLLAMLSGTVGRVCFGLIADRIGNLPTYALASAIQTLCVVAYPLLDTSTSLMVLSVVFGFGFAGNMTCLILCVREAVAEHRFGGALGLTFLVAWIGMGVGGYAGGVLFDIYLSYTAAFVLAGLMGMLNLLTIGVMMLTVRAHQMTHRAPSSGMRTSPA